MRTSFSTKNITFKNYNNSFQTILKNDAIRIKTEPKLVIAADKTSNFYKLNKDDHDELLEKHVTKDYKKAHEKDLEDTTKVDKQIASKLELEDRIYRTTKKHAYITLKDHKPSFQNNPTCRLINPMKPEIGKISKQKLAKIVNIVKTKTKLEQWKNTQAVIKWFQQVKNEKRASFIQFDICEFYPSISQDLLNNALDFASRYVNISVEDREIILHARKTFLFSNGAPWNKKQDSNFDVAMGSFDGAECCDLVGLYILAQLKHLNIKIGLYRDDALGITSMTPRQADLMKKEICKIFKQMKLSITIDVNVKTVNFLDITLDLNTGIYKPFMKPNDTPVYVNKKSNHPPSILKNIPTAVNRRLSSISANEEVFKEAVPPYQEALAKGGYEHQLKYDPPSNNRREGGKRGRKITWFNPPFFRNVATNVGAKFLKIIDKYFPPSNTLPKIININTVKIS